MPCGPGSPIWAVAGPTSTIAVKPTAKDAATALHVSRAVTLCVFHVLIFYILPIAPFQIRCVDEGLDPYFGGQDRRAGFQ